MAAKFHGERILLVEDNTRLLRSAAFLLTVAGFEVITAADGKAALKSLNIQTPQLIIADTDMPELNGYELLRQTRACPQWASIPVIFTSDKYNLDDLMFALDLGAADYVPKPFDIYDLLDAIKRTLPTLPDQGRRLAG